MRYCQLRTDGIDYQVPATIYLVLRSSCIHLSFASTICLSTGTYVDCNKMLLVLLLLLRLVLVSTRTSVPDTDTWYQVVDIKLCGALVTGVRDIFSTIFCVILHNILC